MFRIFDDMFEPYNVTFEIYMENNLINKQTMQAPKEILMANFLQTTKQIQNDNRPLKIKMIRRQSIWDNFANKEKVLDNEICFSNNAMITWEEVKNQCEK